MRRLFVTLFVGLVVFAVVAWATGLYQPYLPEKEKPKAAAKDDARTAAVRRIQETIDWGQRLYRGRPVDDRISVRRLGADPIVIPDCHLAVPTTEKLDVPSRVDGKLLFVGQPVSRAAYGSNPSVKRAPTYKDGKKDWIYYRPLQEGSFVDSDEVVAVIDPTLALNQVALKEAKLNSAKADRKASAALAEYYGAELRRAEGLRSRKGIAEAEYAIAVAQYEKAKQELTSKQEAITMADRELKEAQTMLQYHYLSNTIPDGSGSDARLRRSIIRTVFKGPGESVKNLDPVLQIHNISRLRAEGLADVQYLHSLREGTHVEVYPSRRREPLRTFVGHRGAINAVAVSGDERDPLVVSGSDDNTARVWQRRQKEEKQVWYHDTAVRAVACSPAGVKRNYCLTGCADGTVRLYDLDKLSPEPLKKAPLHKEAVNCLAFSPDGKWFATGTEGGTIALWNVEAHQTWADDPEPKYTFRTDLGHLGAVTALHFTPDLQLVSAGRDNTLRVWTLYEKGARLNHDRALTDRSGSVADLGVSRDGKYLLFDQEKNLQVMSVKDGRTVGVIKDPSGATPFESFAVFSPDGTLVLTSSASEGRLQLWRAPTGAARMHEVRQFVTQDASTPTCAAFGEDAKLAALADPKSERTAGAHDAHRVFAVTGSREGAVYLWAVPGQKQVDQKTLGTIRLVESYVEASTRQARVWVEVDNDGELRPGETVTVVVPR
jgi:WD40 repeat protein